MAVAAVWVAGDLMLMPRNMQVSRQAALVLIGVYQAEVSPRLRSRVVCRFTPSCSEYARQCFLHMRTLSATSVTLDRLSRCNEATQPGTPDPAPTD